MSQNEMLSEAIFLFADVKWTSITGRNQHFARFLSDEYDVFFCHPETKPPISLSLRTIRPGLVDVPLLGIPTNVRNKKALWLAPVFRALSGVPIVGSLLSLFNVYRLKKLARPYQRVHVVASSVLLGETTRRFAPSANGAVIADVVDAISVSGAPEQVSRHFRSFIREADAAVITHPDLRAEGAKHVTLIRNGVDKTYFIGSRLKPMRPPVRAIYVGHMAYVDWEFLARTIFILVLRDSQNTRPGPSVVFTFVGPVSDDLLALQKTFPAYVVVAGQQSYAECARMIKNSHVGIIPFLRVPETAPVDANKYYEYVAGGCCVAATEYQREEYPYMAETNEPLVFADLLTNPPVPEPGTVEKLTSEADWRKRLDQLIGLINKIDRTKESIRLTSEK